MTVTLWRDLAETAGALPSRIPLCTTLPLCSATSPVQNVHLCATQRTRPPLTTRPPCTGAELEPLSHPTVALSKLKVSDFNGVSLSATYATAVEVNPAGYAATDALRAWWDAEGAGLTFAPAGDGAARAGAAGAPRSEWAPLEDVGAERAGASEADKPAYACVRAVVTRVPEEQQLYYEANPATNKKARLPCLACLARLLRLTCLAYASARVAWRVSGRSGRV